MDVRRKEKSGGCCGTEWNGSSRLANGRSSSVGQTVVHVLATAESCSKSMAATTTLCHKPQVSAVSWWILTAWRCSIHSVLLKWLGSGDVTELGCGSWM